MKSSFVLALIAAIGAYSGFMLSNVSVANAVMSAGPNQEIYVVPALVESGLANHTGKLVGYFSYCPNQPIVGPACSVVGPVNWLWTQIEGPPVTLHDVK